MRRAVRCFSLPAFEDGINHEPEPMAYGGFHCRCAGSGYPGQAHRPCRTAKQEHPRRMIWGTSKPRKPGDRMSIAVGFNGEVYNPRQPGVVLRESTLAAYLDQFSDEGKKYNLKRLRGLGETHFFYEVSTD